MNRVEFTADKPFQHFTVELIVESSLAQVNKISNSQGRPPCDRFVSLVNFMIYIYITKIKSFYYRY